MAVTARTDVEQIGLGDMFTYELIVHGDGRLLSPEPPETEGIILLHPLPRTSRSVAPADGRRATVTHYRWSMRPLRIGEARILPHSLEIDGRIYLTDELIVHVTDRSGAMRRGEAITSVGAIEAPAVMPTPGTEVVLDAGPTMRTAFEHEQIVMTYRMLFLHGSQVRRNRMDGPWEAAGFWREEMDVQMRPTVTRIEIEGVPYDGFVLKRAALFGTRAGALTVSPLRIETDVWPDVTDGRTPSRFQPRKVASEAVTVDVRPLPPGAPRGFGGAVGSFSLTTELDRAEVRVGEASALRAVVVGDGNPNLIDVAFDAQPEGLDVIGPEIRTEVTRDGDRLTTRRTFTFTVIPLSEGAHRLPSVRFAYFDPLDEQYRILTEGAAAITARGRLLTSESPHDAFPMAADRTRRGSERSWMWIAAGFVLIPAIVLLGFLAQRLRRPAGHPVPAGPPRAAARPSAPALPTRAENSPTAFAAAEKAILDHLAARLGPRARAAGRGDLYRLLEDAGVPAEMARELLDFLAESDRARFAPTANDTPPQAILTRARAILRRLDELGI
jgi:hypothetical protein